MLTEATKGDLSKIFQDVTEQVNADVEMMRTTACAVVEGLQFLSAQTGPNGFTVKVNEVITPDQKYIEIYSEAPGRVLKHIKVEPRWLYLDKHVYEPAEEGVTRFLKDAADQVADFYACRRLKSSSPKP